VAVHSPGCATRARLRFYHPARATSGVLDRPNLRGDAYVHTLVSARLSPVFFGKPPPGAGPSASLGSVPKRVLVVALSALKRP
jgi:hypothetical protein